MSRQIIEPFHDSYSQAFRSSLNTSCVRSISKRRNGQFRAQLVDGRQLTLHGQACVGKGDIVRWSDSVVQVLCTSGITEVHPPYSAISKHIIAGEPRIIEVKEPTTPPERDGIAFLRSLHYRKGLPFGRCASLNRRKLSGRARVKYLASWS